MSKKHVEIEIHVVRSVSFARSSYRSYRLGFLALKREGGDNAFRHPTRLKLDVRVFHREFTRLSASKTNPCASLRPSRCSLLGNPNVRGRYASLGTLPPITNITSEIHSLSNKL